MPQSYTKLFPPPAAISRGTERNRINDPSSPNRNSGEGGGRSGRGSKGSNKRDDDTQNSRSQGSNSNPTKGDSPDKDSGISIVNKMPYSKCTRNKDGADQPPKITADGKEL